MGKMKDLDKSKVYNLGDLSDEQLDQVCEWLENNDTNWGEYYLGLIKNRDNNKLYYLHFEWRLGVVYENDQTTNALELFEDEQKQITEDINNVFKKESILQEAERIINGARAEDYGDVEENFTRIADGWKVIFGIENISPRQVAHAMTWLKICRDLNTPKRDNLVDICGYTGCIEKMENKEKV